MDNVNFASINSSFDNLDLNVLSSTKEEMDILSSTKKEMDAREDLDVYRRYGAEEQNRKESLRAISPAIQEKQSNLQQPRLSTTNDCKGEWSHNRHSYPSGCSLLPLHDQLSPPKERSQEKEKEKGIHISETDEISFSASRTTSSMDNYNSEQSQSLSNNNQRFLEIKPGEDYQRCIWCISYASQKDKESFITTRERPTPSSSGAKWRCNFKDRRVGIRELRGDECLDFLMPAQTRSPNQFSNDKNPLERNNATMQKLPSLSELVDTTKNKRGYHELQPKHESLIDQENKEYFNDEYGITDINPLLVDDYGMTVLFVDGRGILFEWCELTRDMYVLGINEMEGLANFLYHPEKKLIITEDTAELIPYVELVHHAKEWAEAELAKITKV